MAVIRNIVVKIGADISDLQKGLNDAQGNLKKMSKNITAVGKDLTAGLTVPIVGAAAGLLKLGVDFDDAFDKIRVGTGATGEALSGLQNDFKAVYSTVPSGMADVSTAIADLNTRTGMTGKPLQEMASQLLNLSRITGEDLNGMISSSTRLLGDWSVSADKSSTTMDYLFKVSQSTGIGFNRLNDLMVQFGAPLRQMGFDLESSAAMLGKFEKEGVNTELVLGGLRKALGTMAKSGIKDNAAALAEITTRIKEAGSAGEANRVAIELFGARVGPDMAAAIREGRFELTELVSQLKSSPETINGVATETADFAEQLTLMKNNLLTALEPLGASLMQAINSVMPAFDSFAEKLTGLITWFTSLDEGVKTFIFTMLGVLAAIGPVIMIVGGIVSGLSSLMGILSFLLSPIGLIIIAVVALVAAFVYLWNTNEDFKNALITTWQAISDAVKPIFDAIYEVVSSVFTQILDSLKVFFGYLQPIWESIKQLFMSLWDVIQQLWKLLEPVFVALGAIVVTLMGIWVGVINGIIQALGPFIQAVISAVDIIINVIGLIIALLRGDWSAAWDFMKKIAVGIWEVIKGVFMTIINFIKGFVEGIISFFKGLWNAIVGHSIIPDLVNGVLNWFKNMFSGISNAVSNIVGAVKDAFKAVFDTIGGAIKNAWNWGSDMVKGLADGIRSGIGAVGNAVKGVAGKISDFLGFRSPTKEGPGSRSDKWIPNLFKMLDDSIKQEIPRLNAALSGAMRFEVPLAPSLLLNSNGDTLPRGASYENNITIKTEGSINEQYLANLIERRLIRLLEG